MKNRYFIISDEVKIVSRKKNHYSHFDIIPANNIVEAVKIIKNLRPNIHHFTFLTFAEVNSVYIAMNLKTDEQLFEKLKENIKSGQ